MESHLRIFAKDVWTFLKITERLSLPFAPDSIYSPRSRRVGRSSQATRAVDIGDVGGSPAITILARRIGSTSDRVYHLHVIFM